MISLKCLLFHSVLWVGLLMAACAGIKTVDLEKVEVSTGMVPQRRAPTVSDPVKGHEIEEIKERIKNSEARRDFQKVLQGWKRVYSLDPENQEAQRMVSQLEEGLRRAIAEHMRAGMAFYQQGEFEKSKKELLLVLFLDPGQKEAWIHLRRISLLENTTMPQRRWIHQVPDPSGDYIFHPLKEGETLSMIAEKYFGDPSKSQVIADANAISDVARVRAGRIIKVPLPTAGASQTQNGAKPTLTVGGQIEMRSPGPIPMKSMPGEDSLEQQLNLAKRLYRENKIIEAAAEFRDITHRRPDQKEATNYLERSQTIIDGLKNATSLDAAQKYEAAYDEFNRILSVKPDFTPAVDRVQDLIPLLVAKAGNLLHEEQSPCEAKVLTKKILQRSPNNNDAKNLHDESIEIERGLEMQC